MTTDSLSFRSVVGRHRRPTPRLDRLSGPAAWLLDAVQVLRSAAFVAFVAVVAAALLLLAVNWRF